MINFKSGLFQNQGHYKSFQPTHINREWIINDMKLIQLLSVTDRHIGRLDMYSEYVNIDLYTQMHIAKEATQSTKIEGTQTNIEEVFLKKEDVAFEKRDDWQEVQNYIQAMDYGVQLLKNLPFSTRLIKQTHKLLLQGVRGEHKLPGQYRKSQNWIGGATINDAVFIPPAQNTVDDLISDIEKFANDLQNPMPELLKIALIHYQFETIHPFLDGNGRVGRLMITLYLVEKNILKKPILYLSDFFERNKTLYYDNLSIVREKNDIVQWFKFFLVGIIETAKNSISTFDKILKLQKEIEIKIQKLGSRTGNAQLIINHLYQKPLINVQKVRELTNLTAPPAYKLIAELEQLKIISEFTGAKRGKQYIFRDYIKLFN